MIKILVALILAGCALQASETSSEKAYSYLDQIALEFGTDKNSTAHNYTKIYASVFDDIRIKPLKFLEIGMGGGASVLLWQKYFPYAELHFIDINPTYFTDLPRNIHFHKANQAFSWELKEVMRRTGGEFDIIIDDGGHQMQEQQVSFKTLFPYLKSGGIYIIEDLHTSYWELYGGDGSRSDPRPSPESTTEFLKTLIDELNFVGASTGCANHDGDLSSIEEPLTIYQKAIFSITFYDSLCIIVKRRE